MDTNGNGRQSPEWNFIELENFPKSVNEPELQSKSFDIYPIPGNDIITVKFNSVFTYPVSVEHYKLFRKYCKF